MYSTGMRKGKDKRINRMTMMTSIGNVFQSSLHEKHVFSPGLYKMSLLDIICDQFAKISILIPPSEICRCYKFFLSHQTELKHMIVPTLRQI